MARREKGRKSPTPSSPSRFFKGVKSFLHLSNRNNNNSASNNTNNNNNNLNITSSSKDDIYAREGVAVTLTTEFNNKSTNNSAVTILDSNLSFMPCQPMSSSCFENKAYVHYEPKKAQVAVGTNPDAKHAKSLKLTVEQYAWIIQQLQEEQNVFDSLESTFIHKFQQQQELTLWNISPMLGIISSSASHSKSLGKRLMRFVQQKRKNLLMISVPPPQLSQYQLQCIFMLPKALLLQAAAYIPMTKPLPPPLTHIQHHLLLDHPYQPISNHYKKRLKRYCSYVSLCAHELLAVLTSSISATSAQQHEPSPPPSVTNSDNNKKPVETCKIKCADCSIDTCNLQTIILAQQIIKQQQTKQEELLLQQQQQQDRAPLASSTISSRRTSSILPSFTVIQSDHGQQQQQQSIMFPISFIQYTSITATNTLINSQKLQQLALQKEEKEKQQHHQQHQKKVFMTSAIQPSSSRRVAFDSISKRQKPHAISAFQYIPPDRTMSSSSISSISQYSGIDEEEEYSICDDENSIIHNEGNEEEEEKDINHNEEDDDLFPQKYGYVAVDSENEEILVVFPGMPMSHSLFENASFAAVPWQEIETAIISTTSSTSSNLDKKTPEEDTLPWVLECALTAWTRCEMKVVTLLMRLCSAVPSHYKVAIVGYSLGGAVASLCASSLRSTKLLMNRSITVYAVHSPRVGNRAFLRSLSHQNVKSVRITHHKDLMAHLPPRTSGLLHVGDTTIILPTATIEEGNDQKKNNGYIIENMSPPLIEDVLNRTFSFKDYDLNSNSMVWDVNLDDKVNTCQINTN